MGDLTPLVVMLLLIREYSHCGDKNESVGTYTTLQISMDKMAINIKSSFNIAPAIYSVVALQWHFGSQYLLRFGAIETTAPDDGRGRRLLCY